MCIKNGGGDQGQRRRSWNSSVPPRIAAPNLERERSREIEREHLGGEIRILHFGFSTRCDPSASSPPPHNGQDLPRPSPAFGVCGIFCACRHPAVNIEQWDIQHSTSPDVRRELDLRQDRRGQLSNRHHSDMDATRVTSDS